MSESDISFVLPERIWLRDHSSLNERWVQDQIAKSPSILGLGDLVLKDKERQQPRAGRLDLLLQEVDSNRRYEVEIQLGRTDETHIVRAIEYWDIERKRFPQYDHCAVIVAEDITARFLNIIGLFNGHIPLIALQLTALKVGQHTTLLFTKVLDELTLGLVDEDEEVSEITDRGYWETRGTRDTVALADKMLDLIRAFDPGLELKYNKFYIGLAKNGIASNYVVFRPKKKYTTVEPRLPETSETTEKLESSGLDLMGYDRRWGRYRIRLTQTDLNSNAELLKSLLKEAHSLSTRE